MSLDPGAYKFLACSNCHELVIKGMGDNQQKIRTKVILIKNNAVMAVCKGCGSEIPIPLTFDVELAKSLFQKEEPRLYIKSRK